MQTLEKPNTQTIALADRLLTRCNRKGIPSPVAFALLHRATQQQEQGRADLLPRPFQFARAPQTSTAKR